MNKALRIYRAKLALSWVFIIAFLLAACRSGGPPTVDASGAAPAKRVTALKVYTPVEGIYRLSVADLQPFGMAGSLSSGTDFTLQHRGVPQPFWIEGQGKDAALVFYAQAGSSQFSLENVYILHSGGLAPPGVPNDSPDQPSSETNSLPAARLSPSLLSPGSYYAASRREENRQYLPQAQGAEHWFWAALPAGGSQVLDIPVDSLGESGQEAALLRLSLYGGTEAPTSPDHHALVRVNEQLIADERWDGRGKHIIEANFDPSLLKEGANQFAVEIPGDTGLAAELNYLDWVEIVYPRLLVAVDDRLDFVSPGGGQVLNGFSAPPAVYQVTVPEQAQRLEALNAESAGGNYTVSLPSTVGERYIAVGPQGYLKPSRLVPSVATPDLRQPDLGADYLAVGPADLLAPLQPLLDFRRSLGLQTLAVPVDAVFDQFNYGYPEPQAVQQLMKYAAQSWQPAPRYLLLVGDASYDPRGFLAPPEANRLPTFLVDTVFGGQTASDVGFVQLNEDPWPDLPTGRVPARTPAQVVTFVSKTLAYEQQIAPSQQPQSIFAVADGQEASFQFDAQAFLDQLEPAYSTALFAPPAGDTTASQRVREELANGHLLVAYFGHGSLNMWGKDKLFTVQDVSQLEPSLRLPVVLNLTCLTGLFTHPKVESLAEALLFQPDAGAVAVLAPSSLTLATDQTFLTRPFAHALLDTPQAALGDLHLAARRQVTADEAGQRDVMLTFMLFGDPALRLKLP